jgi:hypothetical protein
MDVKPKCDAATESLLLTGCHFMPKNQFTVQIRSGRSYDIWQRCSFTPPYGLFGASSCSMAVLVCIVRLFCRLFFYRDTKALIQHDYTLSVVQSCHIDRFSYNGG